MDNKQCLTGLELNSIPFISSFVKLINYLIKTLLENKASVFIILVYIIVFYIIYLMLLAYSNRQYIIDNWKEYKCKPFIMPISGFFKNKQGFFKSTLENFNECNWFTFRSYFAILIKPITYIMQIITKTIANITYTINKFRQMAKLLRELFKKMIEQVIDKITTSVSSIQFYTEKFRDLMKKQFAVFQLIYYYLEALRLTFDSFSKGPTPVLLIFLMMFGILLMFLIVICGVCAASIPFVSWVACPICLLCFDKETPIELYNGTSIKISDLKLNDKLKDIDNKENYVIGRLAIKVNRFNQPDIYEYNNILVTGSHIIYEGIEQIPLRIENSKQSKKIYKNIDSIHCLITTHQKLYSKGLLFSDYQETNDLSVQYKWNKIVMEYLNGNNNINFEFSNYYSGFLPYTIINGKHIKNIKLGDKINGKEIFGIVELAVDERLEMYLFEGIICSGNNIVYDEHKMIWNYVHQIENAKKINIGNNDRIYHLMIEDCILTINGHKFRDFLEIHDINQYDILHDLNLNAIKNN